MESDDSLNVSPALKAKFVELVESKKHPLEELVQALYINANFPYTSVGDLVNHYESRYEVLTLEKWKYIFKKLQFSKECKDLLELHKSETMLDPTPTAVGQVNYRGLLSVGNQGAKERTILKTEQLPPPLSTLPVIPEGNFDDPPYFRESPPASPTIPEGAETGETLPSVATGHNNNRPNQTNSVDVDVDATGNNGFKTETQQELELNSEAFQQLRARNVQLEAELNSTRLHNETLSHKMTELEQTSKNELELISEVFQQLQARNVQLEAELNSTRLHNETLSHQMAERAQASDNGIEPGADEQSDPFPHLQESVSRLDTQKTRSSSKNWPEWSLPPPSADNLSQETGKETTMEIRDDEAGERDVSSDGQNLQEFWSGDSSLSSLAPLPAVVQSSQLEQFTEPDTSVTNNEEGLNPVAGQENDVVGETGPHIADDSGAREYRGAIPKRNLYQPSHSTGGKTEHQTQSMTSLSNKQLDHFEIVPDRPKTLERAHPVRNSHPVVIGCRNNRSNQTDQVDGVLENGEERDRAVEHYNTIKYNGVLEEKKQDNHWFGFLLARQAGDVASQRSSAAVREDNVSDGSGIEPGADERSDPFPHLQESGSEDSSDEEFFDALAPPHLQESDSENSSDEEFFDALAPPHHQESGSEDSSDEEFFDAPAHLLRRMRGHC